MMKMMMQIEEVTLLYDSDSPYKEEMLVRLNANGNPVSEMRR